MRRRRTAQHAEDFGEHLVLTAAHKNRSLVEKLCEDAADRPNVHTKEVLLAAQYNLRRAIPQRHDGIRLPSLQEAGFLR